PHNQGRTQSMRLQKMRLPVTSLQAWLDNQEHDLQVMRNLNVEEVVDQGDGYYVIWGRFTDRSEDQVLSDTRHACYQLAGAALVYCADSTEGDLWADLVRSPSKEHVMRALAAAKAACMNGLLTTQHWWP